MSPLEIVNAHHKGIKVSGQSIVKTKVPVLVEGTIVDIYSTSYNVTEGRGSCIIRTEDGRDVEVFDDTVELLPKKSEAFEKETKFNENQIQVLSQIVIANIQPWQKQSFIQWLYIQFQDFYQVLGLLEDLGLVTAFGDELENLELAVNPEAK